MLSLLRLALQRTQCSQPAVQPVFAAWFSVTVAHVAPVVPSALGISPLFAGSWRLVPEGVAFAMVRLTFGADISRMPGDWMLSLFTAHSG